jgi:hypothetical protein
MPSSEPCRCVVERDQGAAVALLVGIDLLAAVLRAAADVNQEGSPSITGVLPTPKKF